MPFTASHAVFALPFIRTPLPFGAVAVGAMSPDLPLFFPFAPDYELTHGVPSLLWVSLPIAAVLYAVWLLLLRPAAGALTPAWIGTRLPSAWAERPRRATALELVLIVAALLIGVLSHVAWDEFTHTGRSGEELIPALAEMWGPLLGTQWLQMISSALGLLGLALAGALYLRRTRADARASAERDEPRLARVRVGYWIALLASAVIGVTVGVASNGLPGDGPATRLLLFDMGTLAGALMLLCTAAAAGLVLWLRRSANSLG